MAEETFRSPNFYQREIDKSGPVSSEPAGTPAMVVGTANKGPAFVPVTVGKPAEFTSVFGTLNPNCPGTYAAQIYLENKNSLTFLRLLGAGANSTAAESADSKIFGLVKNAGFKLSGSVALSGVDTRDKGVVQFIAAKHMKTSVGSIGMPTFEDNDTLGTSESVNLVRGMLMMPNTARMMILSSSTVPAHPFAASTEDSTLADENGKFKLVISSTLGSAWSSSDGVAGVRVITASFDPSSKDYLGKVLNTDPDKFYQEQHFLYADFAVDPNIAHVSSSCAVGILSGSSNMPVNGKSDRSFRESYGSFDTRYCAPETSWFISQPFGKTEYNLFKIQSLDDGEYANSLYKISISNLKASTDDANKYPTFNVQVRDWNDTDTTPIVLEQFTNCTLDPSSPDYIANKIGDRRVFYNFDVINASEKRLVATGKYSNKSKFIRVVVDDAVANKKVPAESVPFGFRGQDLPVFSANTSVTNTLASANAYLGLSTSGTGLTLSASFMPPVPHRFKVTRGEMTSSVAFVGEPGPNEQTSPAFYWGVKFERSSVSAEPESTKILTSNGVNEKDPMLLSLTKFLGLKQLGVVSTGSYSDTVNNNKFSLSKVALYNTDVAHLTSSVNTHMREAAYIRNAVLDNTDYTWTENSRRRLTFASLLSSGSAATFNRFSQFAKFTNFMQGGFDGTNMLNRDARRMNDKSMSFDAQGGASTGFTVPGFTSNPSGEDINNNVVKSVMTAVDIITDKTQQNNNLIVMPGVRESYVTDYLLKKSSEYGLALTLIDISSYDDNGNRLYDDSVKRPNISMTCNNFDARAIDNSYGGTYFSDIFIDDTVNKRRVKVPASIAALGAIAYNDKVAHPWFAPAGFNRGALDFVKNTQVRLSTADRDRLFASRINPIATLPKSIYVIYAQNTLQLSKSLLTKINVRRLLVEVKRIIIDLANKIVFEKNTPAVRNKFKGDASLQLALIQAQFGIKGFKIVMDDSNNSQEDIDLNRLNGAIIIQPTPAIEFISMDFVITNSGVEFTALYLGISGESNGSD